MQIEHTPKRAAKILLFGLIFSVAVPVIGLIDPLPGPPNSPPPTTIYIQRSDEKSSPPFYNIPTASDDPEHFDAIMRKYAAGGIGGVIVRIGPGLFYTRGVWNGSWGRNAPLGIQDRGFRIQSRCKIIGSGMPGAPTGTTLKLAEVKTNDWLNVVLGTSAAGLSDNNTHMLVKDLLVDCNGDVLAYPKTRFFRDRRPMSIQGVQLWGSASNVIENVHVINAVGFDSRTENFILCINSSGALSLGNLIRNCTVGRFHNPYRVDAFGNPGNAGSCSAITMNRWDQSPGVIEGIIEDCRVMMNGTDGDVRSSEWAYNAHNTRNLIVRNNEATGAQRGFHNDSQPHEALTIAGNRFDMPSGRFNNAVCYAIYLIHGTRWSRVYGNDITLRSEGSSGIVVTGPEYYFRVLQHIGSSDIMIHHNTIRAGSGWPGTAGWSRSQAWGINLESAPYNAQNGTGCYLPERIHVESNTVDSGLVNLVPALGQIWGMVPGQIGHQWGNAGNFPNQPVYGWRYMPDRADFDLSSWPDILFQGSSSTTMKTWQMQPFWESTETMMWPSESGDTWRVIGTADIDRNGTTDLLFKNREGRMAFWTLDRTAMRSYGTIVDQYNRDCYATLTWNPVGIADFDNDSHADILFQDNSNFLALWKMNTNRLVSATYLTPNNSGPGWRAVGTGDFNQDGRTDILFQHDNSALAVWFMNGTYIQSAALLSPAFPPHPSWRVRSTADFDRDNHADILFQVKNLPSDPGGVLRFARMWRTQIEGFLQPHEYDDPGEFEVVGPK